MRRDGGATGPKSDSGWLRFGQPGGIASRPVHSSPPHPQIPRARSPPVDPTLPGAPLPPGATTRTLAAGGLSFHLTEGGDPTGAPVLLLHGWPTWGEVWLPLAAQLPANRRWIAPDMPSHGRTSVMAPGQSSFTDLRRAVSALIEALDLKQLAVVGCSIGGTLAVMMAIDHPRRVERVVAIDAQGFVPKLPGKTVRMYLPFFLRAQLGPPGARSVRKLLNKTVFHDPARTSDEWVEATTRAWSSKDRRKGLLAVGGSLRRPDASISSRLEEVACPVLVVWGRNDAQFDWRIGQEAAKRMPDAAFVAIDGAGHFPMVEKPAETAGAVLPFLA